MKLSHVVQQTGTKRTMKTAGKDHCPGAPPKGNTALSTSITTGASTAHYSNNKGAKSREWGLINTREGQSRWTVFIKNTKLDTAYPDRTAAFLDSTCFIWSQDAWQTALHLSQRHSLGFSHHCTLAGRPQIKTDTHVLYLHWLISVDFHNYPTTICLFI